MALLAAWKWAKNIISEFMKDDAFELAAAVSFYALLSIAPLLTVMVALAGMVFGEEAASGRLVREVQRFVGVEGAQVAQTVLEHANVPRRGIVAIIVGIDILIFGATAGFVQLQNSLNRIWGVKANTGKDIWKFLKARLLSLLMVIGLGLVLLVFLLASAALCAIGAYLADVVPRFSAAWLVIDIAASLIVSAVVFAMVFKILPDVEMSWREVRIGAIVTAVLFTIGTSVTGLYLGYSGVGSVFGAASSVVALVVWVYYSAMILFLGAEFTKVYCRGAGSRPAPSERAEPARGGKLAPG